MESGIVCVNDWMTEMAGWHAAKDVWADFNNELQGPKHD